MENRPKCQNLSHDMVFRRLIGQTNKSVCECDRPSNVKTISVVVSMVKKLWNNIETMFNGCKKVLRNQINTNINTNKSTLK